MAYRLISDDALKRRLIAFGKARQCTHLSIDTVVMMIKAKMYGYYPKCVPNARADALRRKRQKVADVKHSGERTKKFMKVQTVAEDHRT